MHLYLKRKSWRYQEITDGIKTVFYEGKQIFNNFYNIFNASINKGFVPTFPPYLDTFARSIINVLQHWGENSRFVFYILVFFTNVFDFLEYNYHQRHLRIVLPEILLASIFFYDLVNQEFNYIFYYLFIYLFISFLRRLDKFLTFEIFIYYYFIGNYFYKNTIPYETQRFYILNDKEDSIVYTSKENEKMYKYFRNKPNLVTAIITNNDPSSYRPTLNKETDRRLFLFFVITFLTFLMINKYYIIFIYQIIFLLPVSYYGIYY
jgi:hypothetical protein